MKFKKIESAIHTVWGYGTPAQYQAQRKLQNINLF